jgi:ribosomal protein L21
MQGSTSMNWQNNFLPNLDYETLISNVGLANIKIFSGININTIATIHIAGSHTLPQWQDGKPLSATNNSGDGTVLFNNTALGNIAVTKKSKIEHTALPDACKADVVTFLSGTQAKSQQLHGTIEPSTKESVDLQSLLFVGTRDNIHMGITTAEGMHVGNFPFQEGKMSEVETFYYRGDKKQTNAIGIYNPLKGEYILSITTQEAKANYEIYVSYSDNNYDREDVIKGVVTGDESKIYSVIINQQLDIY